MRFLVTSLLLWWHWILADLFLGSSAINQGSDFSSFQPKVFNLQVLTTGPSSLTLEALVNFTNPTEYTATVPYIDIHILNNGSLLGHATAKTITVGPGENFNMPVTAVWDPLTMGGEKARAVGIELLSQYISGMIIYLTLLLTPNGRRPKHDAHSSNTRRLRSISAKSGPSTAKVRGRATNSKSWRSQRQWWRR